MLGALTLLAAAQDSDTPTIAILRFGATQSIGLTEDGILDVLQSYGFISADENQALSLREDFAGDKINIVWGDAGFNLGNVNLIVAEALDQDVDAIVAISVPIALTAINQTLDMDDPAGDALHLRLRTLRSWHRRIVLHQAQSCNRLGIHHQLRNRPSTAS